MINDRDDNISNIEYFQGIRSHNAWQILADSASIPADTSRDPINETTDVKNMEL